ncbi:hypothetical protein DYE48_00800 [Halobacillus trueperi]|uniref:Uncharacterized protein n=1 Tax=Halobacillus trueperi TaxID=156205 RepID=A0A3E0JDH5_9BACI|nr:hypothetical protein DYE48_00800 [Halobacillus trueperi]
MLRGTEEDVNVFLNILFLMKHPPSVSSLEEKHTSNIDRTYEKKDACKKSRGFRNGSCLFLGDVPS